MIEAKNLELIYEDAGAEVRAVDGVSLSIEENRILGIGGPSGSGKSSLLYLLAGLKEPDGGEVRFRDQVVSGLSIDDRARIRRKHFGFVFQNSFLIPYLTVVENVRVLDETGTEQKARQLLESLDLAHVLHRRPYQISTGERQRAALARAVFHDPDVIFADEPTASLDRENADRVISLLMRRKGSATIVLVTHDETVLKNADKVVRMFGGKVATDSA